MGRLFSRTSRDHPGKTKKSIGKRALSIALTALLPLGTLAGSVTPASAAGNAGIFASTNLSKNATAFKNYYSNNAVTSKGTKANDYKNQSAAVVKTDGATVVADNVSEKAAGSKGKWTHENGFGDWISKDYAYFPYMTSKTTFEDFDSENDDYWKAMIKEVKANNGTTAADHKTAANIAGYYQTFYKKRSTAGNKKAAKTKNKWAVYALGDGGTMGWNAYHLKVFNPKDKKIHSVTMKLRIKKTGVNSYKDNGTDKREYASVIINHSTRPKIYLYANSEITVHIEFISEEDIDALGVKKNEPYPLKSNYGVQDIDNYQYFGFNLHGKLNKMYQSGGKSGTHTYHSNLGYKKVKNRKDKQYYDTFFSSTHDNIDSTTSRGKEAATAFTFNELGSDGIDFTLGSGNLFVHPNSSGPHAMFQLQSNVADADIPPTLTITKDVSDTSWKKGDTIDHYTVTVKQTYKEATEAAKNVVIKDTDFDSDAPVTLDALKNAKATKKVAATGKESALSIKSISNGWEVDAGDLAFNDKVTITFTGTAKKTTDKWINTATASADNTASVKDTAYVTITEPPTATPELSIDKSVTKRTWKKGNSIPYTVKVAQMVKNATANNVVISDGSFADTDALTLDPDSIKISGIEGATLSTSGETWKVTVPSMAYGDTETITFNAKADAATDDFTNTATATADNAKSVKDTAVVNVAESKLSIDKSVEKKTWKKGDTITYKVDLTNDGDTVLTNLELRDYSMADTDALTLVPNRVKINNASAVLDYEGTAYAVYNTSSGELDFIRSKESYTNGSSGTVKSINGKSYTGTIYTGFENNTTNYTGSVDAPWVGIAAKVKTVKFEDVIYPEHTGRWFCNFSNCTSMDLSRLNTSKAKDMHYMFYYCQSLTALNVSNFDTSSATSMDGMFQQCAKLTALDVTGFDTSNVTEFTRMFSDCSSLTSLDVSNFNTSKATEMYNMFANCSKLTSLDVSNFNTANNIYFHYMFDGCSSLTSLNLSGFNTSASQHMRGMFRNCSNLTSLDLSSFNTSKTEDAQNMFNGDSKLKTIYASSAFTTSSITSHTNMFGSCTSLVGGNGTKFSTSHVDKTYARIDKSGTPGYFTSKSAGKSSAVKSITAKNISYENAIVSTADEKLTVSNLSRLAPGKTITITFEVTADKATNGDFTNTAYASATGISEVKDTAVVNVLTTPKLAIDKSVTKKSWAVGDTIPYTVKISNIGDGTAKDVKMQDASMAKTDALTLIPDSVRVNDAGKKNDGAKQADLSGTAYAVFYSDTGELDFVRSTESYTNGSTGTVTSISGGTYTGTIYTGFETETYTKYEEIPWTSNISSVKSVKFVDAVKPKATAYWFTGMTNCTAMDLAKLDTSNVTSMDGMFFFCALPTLDVSGFDTSNATSMVAMFCGCGRLTTLDVSGFDTSKVTNMDNMFCGCGRLTTLNLSSFDTSKVTTMEGMFAECYELTTLNLSSFDTSNVTSMKEMFETCPKLTTIYVSSSFNTLKAADSSSNMFTASPHLVGGNGTVYDSSHLDATYARIDTADTPGYFTELAEPTITTDGEVIRITGLPDLNAGESVTITYNVKAEAATDGDFTNTAYATSSNAGNVNDDAVVEVTQESQEDVDPKLDIQKSVTKKTWQVGDTVPYTVKVTQTVEKAFARNVVISDDDFPQTDCLTLDPDSVKVSGMDTATVSTDGETWEVDVPNMEYNDSVTITFHASADKTTEEDFENVASASCEEISDPVYAKAVVNIVSDPNISISKTVPKKTWDVGDTIPYTAVLSNPGNTTLTNVHFYDNSMADTDALTLIPDSVKIYDDEETDDDGNLKEYTNATVSTMGEKIDITNLPDLAAGKAYRIEYSVTAAKATDNFTNTAYGAATGVNTVNDTAVVNVKEQPKLSIEKIVPKKTWRVGNTVPYTVTVKQTKEGVTATNVTISDDSFPDTDCLTLDPDSVKVTTSGMADSAEEPQVDTDDETWNVVVPEMPYGSSVTITFNASADQVTTEDFTNTARTYCEEVLKPIEATAVVNIIKPAELPQTGAWTWILFSAAGAAVILIRIAVRKKKAK